jgi:serine/threonine protein kinase
VTDRVFGKYDIQKRLAIGGMGEVFYAVQKGVPGFERPVILKSLLPELAAQPDFVEQFLDEARVAATLNHPNVVSIYEVGHWNDAYFIAMEYIRGRNLSQLLRKAQEHQETVPATVAARIVRDAALGLDHAHRAVDQNGAPLSIVHRDVSPQNIMVRDDGVTKVVDFGIARAANRASARTATGALKGKVAYMAPEQILGQDQSPLIDQFALGIVFWEVLAGKRLFKADNDLAIANRVIEDILVRPSTVAPDVPPALEAITMRMLDRKPAGRFQNCAQVATAIDHVLTALEPTWDVPPVQAFMRRLGTADLVLPTLANPSQQKNFFISLKADPAEDVSEDVDLMTATPDSLKQVATQHGPGSQPHHLGLKTGAASSTKSQGTARRTPLLVGAALCTAAATVFGLWLWASNTAPADTVSETRPPAPIVPATSVAVAANTVPSSVPIAEDSPIKGDVPGELTVQTSPKGASLRIDGRPQGSTPAVVSLSANVVHYLQLERPGYKTREVEVTLSADEKKVLPITLEPRERSPSIQNPVTASSTGSGDFGYLTLDTKPWSKVSIDGELAGSTPIFRRRLSAGKHTLSLVNEGENINVTRSVQVLRDNTVKLDLKLP